MPKFRKKPVVIEATRFLDLAADGSINHTGPETTPDWLERAVSSGEVKPHPTHAGKLQVLTLEGEHIADPGDWIICGIKGEIYPCKPDIFEATYEPADSTVWER